MSAPGTSTATAMDARVDANLTAAYADVKAEMARTDNKVALLLAFDGAVMAGLWTAGTGLSLPVAALVVGGVAVALLLASIGVLLAAVRPRLGGTDRCSFPYWAGLTAEELRADMRQDRRPAAIVTLSRIAVAKFERLQLAVDLIRYASIPLVIAAGTAIGGAL
ncbi:Pycsar system effector family protein [Streptomyces violaceusniger]|uniref:Integral membrane plasmid transfer protein n=1 Tax=Streptomyces violaceusniger (strain Tu 4113) TaxID=653045 RepID=G2P9J7_STRV4|nr:Pycsar system effector family protein [Streptomyces violaceusniger]AEM88317.1 putative integral membrane plasmid transfer protein [Streptomyces violaceusniger Tu 4113]